MAKRTRKQTLPELESLPPSIIYRPVANKKPSKTNRWGNSLLALALILTAASAVAGGAWWSLQLFVNPDAVNDVNKILPEGAKFSASNPEQQPQTLKQIEDSLRTQGKTAGELLTLETDAKTSAIKSLVLPVLKKQSNCQTDCQEIVELRIYQLVINKFKLPFQSEQTTYQLISQLPVSGPDESFAISPVVDSETANYGSTQLLPLTQLQRFSGTTPKSGTWLYLIGQRQHSDNGIAYGQILHYDRSRSALSLVLTWTSPTGQAPKWQEVTGGGFPELLVDRTSELEPQLQVYQVKPAQASFNQFQLVPISIEEPAIKTTAYRNALFLARSGLWTPAWQWLKALPQGKKRPSAAAQAQIDLIGLYAKYTSKKADTAWASPSQQAIAALSDGRWEKGLQIYQASPENTQEIATFLVNDSGRLWNRVEAALKINPRRPEVQAWGALILGAQEGQANALIWLKAQPHSPKTLTYVEKLLKRLDGDYGVSLPVANRPSRIIGYLEPVSNINLADWLPIEPKSLTKNQKWQQIRVITYNNGQTWLRSPFDKLKLPNTERAKFLWQQLGLNIDPNLDLVLRLPNEQSPTTTTVNVQAVQWENGVLRLLVPAQTELQPQQIPLAVSAKALEWVEPTKMTLTEFLKQESVDATEFLPAVWRELSANKSLLKFEQLQQELATLTVGLVDLTGDDNQDLILTISEREIATLTKNKSYKGGERTIAFSDTGELIYSEFSSPVGKFKAIADLKDAAPPVLLIENAKKYNIQRWSAINQRFE
ncbi:hypothetical protein [Synechocystis sp. PCC 7509]|uniref:hypothetical protein n=1 Tax=Synechocystis sp. PCC 7509 TaxID=927677 RepID=UPI00048D84E9|nr:hypothetical protein [Synechocystis sp. PCC 7509]